MKKCCSCKQELPLSCFHKNKGMPDGYTHNCLTCCAKRHHLYQKTEMGQRKSKEAIWKRAGIINADGSLFKIPDFVAWLNIQKNMCKICKIVPEKTLHVDHDHATGVVRGLLCQKCNHGLGLFNDSELLLSIASDYLSKKGGV